MKLIKLTCDKCGASLNIDPDNRIAFCPYCGAKLLINDESIRIVDEARLREISLEEERQRRQWQKEDDERLAVKQWHRKVVLFFVIPILIGLAGGFIGLYLHKNVSYDAAESLFFFYFISSIFAAPIISIVLSVKRPSPETFTPTSTWFKTGRFLLFFKLYLFWTFTSFIASTVLFFTISGVIN